MSGSAILISVAILGGIGLTFGTLIALAHRKLWVWVDLRIDTVAGLLPGTNCGACGLPGCHAFAESVVDGKVTPADCPVMGPAEIEAVAGYLGVEAGESNKVVARLLCAGGSNVSTQKADYHGIATCAAAVAVAGGGKGCAWGCVGLADCEVACTFDAIRMNEFDLPVVDPELCTACNLCVEACPLDLFVLMPLEHKLIVQCRILLSGDAATDVCSVACDACGRCVVDAKPGLIEMRSGLAVIDYGKIELAEPAATARCPTGAIVWVEGWQFDPVPDAVPGRGRGESGGKERSEAGSEAA